MQVAARRPYLAAGVALVGASVIAASSVSPLPDIHLPDVHLPAISAADVNLAALANPLEVYAQVFQTALSNLGTLADHSMPGQLLSQIIANQVSSAGALGAGLATTGADIGKAAGQIPATVATAVSQLTAGNVSGAVNTLLGVPVGLALPITDLLPALQTILTKPLQNIVNVVDSFTRDPLATQLLLAGFIAPLISTPAAAATAFQNILDAVGTGDISAVVNAIVTAPATIADGLLNGGYGPDLAPIVGQTGVIVKAGGLFGSSDLTVDPAGNLVVSTGGPMAALQALIKQITNAITPPAAAAPAAQALSQTDPASITAITSSTVGLPPASATTVGAVKTAPASNTATDPATDATAPAKSPTEVATGEADPTAAAPTQAPTEAPKDAGDAATSTPADTKSGTDATGAGTTKDGDTAGATKDGDTAGTTKDATKDAPKDTPSKDESVASSPSKKPTTTNPDVKTGNKVEPKSPTAEHPTKSGDTAATGTSAEQPSGGSATGSHDGAGSAGKGADSKGSSS